MGTIFLVLYQFVSVQYHLRIRMIFLIYLMVLQCTDKSWVGNDNTFNILESWPLRYHVILAGLKSCAGKMAAQLHLQHTILEGNS